LTLATKTMSEVLSVPSTGSNRMKTSTQVYRELKAAQFTDPQAKALVEISCAFQKIPDRMSETPRPKELNRNSAEL
jgi:hypothetical protein